VVNLVAALTTTLPVAWRTSVGMRPTVHGLLEFGDDHRTLQKRHLEHWVTTWFRVDWVKHKSGCSTSGALLALSIPVPNRISDANERPAAKDFPCGDFLGAHVQTDALDRPRSRPSFLLTAVTRSRRECTPRLAPCAGGYEKIRPTR
jgi:hypothetical protein